VLSCALACKWVSAIGKCSRYLPDMDAAQAKAQSGRIEPVIDIRAARALGLTAP
jgi:hypothetical protein